MSEIYVGTIKNDPVLEEWEKEWDIISTEAEEKKKFLMLQADQMHEKIQAHWKKLWDEFQARGTIDKDFKYSDYGMRRNKNTKQVFIELENDGLPSFLRNLLK